jgi:hypothetical protein
VRIVGKNKKKYHTPLILRTGFLHSYKRTLPVIVFWLILNLVTYWRMGVLTEILGDPWIALYLPLFVLVIHIARKAVSGYDDLFGIFDSEFEKELRLYTSLDVETNPDNQENHRADRINQEDDRIDLTNQERIKDIFEKEQHYEKFKSKIRGMVFSSWERVIVFAVIIASPVIAYIYFDAYLYVGVYGSFTPPEWLYIYIISNLIIGFAIVLCLASLCWIVLSMILSISKLEEHKVEFKIRNYIKLLKGEKFERLDRVMGYDTFYERTTAIGSFIYGITLRALVIMIAYALNLIFFSFLNQLNIGIGVYAIGLSIIGFAIIIFFWPQLGLHNLLNNRKKEIMRELILKQDTLDTEVMHMTSESDRSSFTVNEVALQREASERVGSIYRNVKERSTWGFEITTMIKYIGTSAVPFITTVISAISEGLAAGP